MQINESCEKHQDIREYSHLQEFVDNLPYIIMVLLGAAIFFIGFGASPLRWVTSGLCILYGIVGAFWIIVFVCPYCHYYGTRLCPCGYGSLAAKLRAKSDDSLFMRKFRKHIPAIVPLWFLPLATGLIFLILNFSLLMLALIVLFAVNSFVILPLLSTRYGCAHCPQRSECPWMKHKSGDSSGFPLSQE